MNLKDAWNAVNGYFKNGSFPRVIRETSGYFLFSVESTDMPEGSATGPYCIIYDKKERKVKIGLPPSYAFIRSYTSDDLKAL